MAKIKLFLAMLSMAFVSTALCQAQGDQHSDILNAFGLSNADIVELDKIDFGADGSVSEFVTVKGQPYTLDLQRHSVRSSNYEVRVQLADGSFQQHQSRPSRLVRGVVRGVAGTRVVGSVVGSGLAAKIIMPGNQTFFMEPVASRYGGAAAGAHVVYQGSDVVTHNINCGVIDPKTMRRDVVQHQRARNEIPVDLSGLSGTTLLVAELAIDADYEFFQLQGGDVQATVDRVELVVGITNDQYETQTGLTHAISTLIVRSAEPDPYNSNSAFTLLDQFMAHWENEQQSVERDAAHLFSGNPPSDGIGGVAYLGGMCSGEMAYGMSRIDFNGDLVCSTDLLAHELGHNWNANHCSCPNNTMNGGLTCTNVFTNGSINSIVAFANSLDCLDEQGGVLLGDVNLDGVVNLLDVAPFVDLLSSSGFQLEADINQDGVVNLLDVGLFVELLGA